MKLLKIIAKNFRILFRNKLSSLVILLGPLALIILSGLAFNNLQSFSLNIGVYSEDYNNLTEKVVQAIDVNYGVEKYSTIEQCQEDVKQRNIHACLLFPAGFEIGNEEKNQITYVIDQSNVNLAWTVSKTISDIVQEESQEISLNMTSGILQKLDDTQAHLAMESQKLSQLINENRDTKTKAGSIEEESQGIGSITALESRVTSLKTYAEQAVVESKALIEDIKDETNDPAVLDVVEDAEEQILDIEQDIEDLDNATRFGNETLDELMTSLNQLDNLRSEVVQKIGTINNNLQSSLTKLEEIKSSAQALDNSIENINIRQATGIVTPFTTTIQPVTSEKTQLTYLFPSLLVLVIMLMTVIMASTVTVYEKITPAFFRNSTTPTRDGTFTLSIFLTVVITLIVQLIVVMAASAYFFKLNLLSNLQNISTVLLLLVILFTMLGMLIGIIFKSQETSVVAAISLVAVLFFMSNLILPTETMPEKIQQIAEYNPFVMGEAVVKKAMLFNQGLYQLRAEALMLLAYAAGALILIVLIQKITKARVLKFYNVQKAKKRGKERAEKELREKIEGLKPGQYFELKDGTMIKNLKDMITALEGMSEEEFKKYVSKKKNDFANWAEKVLNNRKLANELRKIKKKEDLLDKLEERKKSERKGFWPFKRKDKETKQQEKEAQAKQREEKIKKKLQKKHEKRKRKEEAKKKKEAKKTTKKESALDQAEKMAKKAEKKK